MKTKMKTEVTRKHSMWCQYFSKLGIASVDTQKRKNKTKTKTKQNKQKTDQKRKKETKTKTKLVAYYSQGLPRWVSRHPEDQIEEKIEKKLGKLGENNRRMRKKFGNFPLLPTRRDPRLRVWLRTWKKVTNLVFFFFNVLWNVPLLKIKGIYSNIWEKTELQIIIDKLTTDYQHYYVN